MPTCSRGQPGCTRSGDDEVARAPPPGTAGLPRQLPSGLALEEPSGARGKRPRARNPGRAERGRRTAAAAVSGPDEDALRPREASASAPWSGWAPGVDAAAGPPEGGPPRLHPARAADTTATTPTKRLGAIRAAGERAACPESVGWRIHPRPMLPRRRPRRSFPDLSPTPKHYPSPSGPSHAQCPRLPRGARLVGVPGWELPPKPWNRRRSRGRGPGRRIRAARGLRGPPLRCRRRRRR